MITVKYRPNVAIIVCNSQGQVLLCARIDQKEYDWQFPQGGIDNGETVLEAAYRELREETGIIEVDLIAEMPGFQRYNFPPAVVERFKKNGCPYIGQDQHYVLFRLKNDNQNIDFETHPEEIEFKACKWAEIDVAPQEIVYFKKEAYVKAVEYFKPFLENIKKADIINKKRP